MAHIIQPWHVLLAAFAGWINRHQQATIDYLREENRILLEQLGERRIRFTDDQRRRLALAGKAVGRKALQDFASMVSPDSILAWHRKLVAAKWDQREKRFCLMDRDTKFAAAFRALLDDAGTESVRLPARSPILNAWIERYMRSIKSECLDRMILFSEASLRRAVVEYLAHYHTERNHQGLDNAIIAPMPGPARPFGRGRCRERLGGMLRYYHRHAA